MRDQGPKLGGTCLSRLAHRTASVCLFMFNQVQIVVHSGHLLARKVELLKTVLPNLMNLRNMPVAALPALEKIPGVVRIEEDKYHPNLVKLNISTPLIEGLQSQIEKAGLSDAGGNVADGKDVRVCVCDTGIYTGHEMYYARIDMDASVVSQE